MFLHSVYISLCKLPVFSLHMSLVISSPPNWGLIRKLKVGALENQLNSYSSSSVSISQRRQIRVKACPVNPPDEPIIREAFKEPVAFMGGIFAGLLRLDLNEDPLKEWVSRTVEASGISNEEIDSSSGKPEEEIPQQIEIE